MHNSTGKSYTVKVERHNATSATSKMPPVVLERPKMSRGMWDALKSHIVRERHRKQQELEANAEVERQRKERERQQKQDSMTLSETRDQISVLECRLSELKEEKHQVFLQLKKVLNEDEVRKRQLISQEQTSGEIFGVRGVGNYAPGMQIPPAGQQMFLQQVTLTRPPPTAVYKGVPVSHPPAHSSHTLLPPGSMKRSRSPSPPPHQQNNYKFGPFKPPPHAIHSYPQHKPGPVGGLQFFPSQQSIQQQPPHSTPTPPSFSSGHPPPHSQPGTVFTYAGAPPSRSPQSAPGRDEPSKHSAIYLPHSTAVPRSYVMHPPVEVRTHTPPPQKFGDDSPKYYPPPTHSLPIRSSTHMSIHPGLSIQAPQVGISTGSITSGYPIRTQPSATSFQGRPPSPHITYSGQAGPPRLAYGHPHSAHIPTSAPHPNTQRYMPPGMQRDRD